MHWISVMDALSDILHIIIIPFIGGVIWMIKYLITLDSRMQKLENTTINVEEFNELKESIIELRTMVQYITTKDDLQNFEKKLMSMVGTSKQKRSKKTSS